MKNYKLSVIIIFMLTLLSGCQGNEIPDLIFSIGIGVDWQDNQIELTSEFIKPTATKEDSREDSSAVILSGKGRTLAEASNLLSDFLPQTPLWNHVSIVLLGENLCKTDVALVSDYLTRTTEIKHNIPLLVISGSNPEEIFKTKPVLETYLSTSLARTLKNEEKQLNMYKPVLMYEFMRKLITPGIEPVLPQIKKVKDGEKYILSLDGLAVFKGPRMIASLNEAESKGYHYLTGKNINSGLLLINNPEDPGYFITFELTKLAAEIKPLIEKENQRITMLIQVHADGNFYEQSGGGDLLRLDKYPQLEQMAEDKINAYISNCIDKAQNINSDILGWGQLINQADTHFWGGIAPQWDTMFPAVNYQLQSDFIIRRTYLTSKSYYFQE
ncbi:MAG: Ger(x)C family spore germination protein [Syntrophomonadaceae bacterium]|jgi:Ger(x)C family germination protein|nr:Ger(x)C family spore germination protein [Syntrophomonadaceae bacterium]